MIRDQLPIREVLDIRRTHSMPDLEFTGYEEIKMMKGEFPVALKVEDPGDLHLKIKTKAFDDQ